MGTFHPLGLDGQKTIPPTGFPKPGIGFSVGGTGISIGGVGNAVGGRWGGGEGVGGDYSSPSPDQSSLFQPSPSERTPDSLSMVVEPP